MFHKITAVEIVNKKITNLPTWGVKFSSGTIQVVSKELALDIINRNIPKEITIGNNARKINHLCQKCGTVMTIKLQETYKF